LENKDARARYGVLKEPDRTGGEATLALSGTDKRSPPEGSGVAVRGESSRGHKAPSESLLQNGTENLNQCINWESPVTDRTVFDPNQAV
jgi:hypothetical protein